jgi:hypothetical protein
MYVTLTLPQVSVTYVDEGYRTVRETEVFVEVAIPFGIGN